MLHRGPASVHASWLELREPADRLATVGFVGDEREADVPLAALPEPAARRDEDVALEQPLREPARVAEALGHAPPQIEGRLAAVVVPAALLEQLEEELAAPAIRRDD